MKLRIGLKLFTLLIAFSATLYAIFILKTGHMNDFWVSLGFNTSEQTLNWCSNRLIKLESLTETKWKLEENSQKWQISKDEESPLDVDYVEVEKWLAKYCFLKIIPFKDKNLLDMQFKPFAKASFNDGSKVLIYTFNGEVFQINEVIFKSQEMVSALKDLKNLLKF